VSSPRRRPPPAGPSTSRAAFFGSDLEDDTIRVLADFLAAGGGLVFNTGAPFDWFHQHVVRGLVTELGIDDIC
jgi:hypothetical protein